MHLLRANALQLENTAFIIKEDTSQYRSNRDFKDGMFRLLFDDEEKCLELFNALEDTNYTKAELMEIVTLEDAIYNQFINDLSFQYSFQFLSIVEHQSTWSENLPLRELLYLARIYEKVLDLRSAYKKHLYKIPVPHMYMLYNGEPDQPAEQMLRLSDAFSHLVEKPTAELIVKMININNDKNHPILKRSPTLKGYAVFIERVRENMRYQYMDRDEAIRDAIISCIKDGILEEFLQKHGSEVYNMLFTEITYEDIMDIRVEEAVEEAVGKAVEEAVEEAVSEAVEEAVKEASAAAKEENTKTIVLAMLQKGLAPDEIHKLTEIPINTIREIRGHSKI